MLKSCRCRWTKQYELIILNRSIIIACLYGSLVGFDLNVTSHLNFALMVQLILKICNPAVQIHSYLPTDIYTTGITVKNDTFFSNFRRPLGYFWKFQINLKEILLTKLNRKETFYIIRLKTLCTHAFKNSAFYLGVLNIWADL